MLTGQNWSRERLSLNRRRARVFLLYPASTTRFSIDPLPGRGKSFFCCFFISSINFYWLKLFSKLW